MMVGLFLLFLQDIRTRLVSVFLLIYLFVMAFLRSGYSESFPVILSNWIINSVFLLMLASLSLSYLIIKNKQDWKAISQYVGLGDGLFAIILAILFSPINFIAFFVSSLVFSLLIFLIFFKVGKQTIPLAGLQALYLIFFLIGGWLFFQINFQNDYLLLKLWE